MRSADRRTAIIALAAAVATGGCAIDLDDAEPEPDPDAPPIAETCTIAGATGRVRVVDLDDDNRVVIADSVDATLPATASDCESLDAPAPIAATVDGSLLSAFVVAVTDTHTVYAFVERSQGFESLGVTLATYDPASTTFTNAPDYLFAAGRPTYGDASLVDGDHVYAYGCQSTGFLSEDCYVARAPIATLTDPTAWEYYVDGNAWAAHPDDAWPMWGSGGGGHGLTVRRKGERIVVAYATPLGSTIEVRTGLGPTGPWSPATSVATCEVPDGGFCTGFTWVPAFDTHDPADGPDQLALTYAIASFDPLPAASRQTRLTRVALP